MTFTEAAIEVLRREGKPLHFTKLAEIAARENLLDHVGKIPEETMAGQLAAHCRLPRPERRVIPVDKGTFALTEWGLDEDPAGLEGLVEPPPESELPYRGRERHPIPARDLGRAARGEGGRARRREEEERRGRRFPPPAEVAYEILAGAGKPLSLADIAATGAERLLMPDAFVRDDASLRAALVEDNRRRESSGRKPLFQLDADAVTLVAQPEPGERAAAPAAVRVAPATAPELRRAALAGLRRRLRECDGPTVEHVATRLLEKLGYRELKVAKRGREHVVCTAKRRLGLADVRHAIRILRSGADAARRDVTDLRRDLGHYGAQIGVVVTAGEAAREARGEAAAAGQLPVVLLCGEALAEAFAEAGVGCVPVVVPEVDDAFFTRAAEEAEREESARRTRRDEREKREAGRRDEAPAAPAEAGGEVVSAAPARAERPERPERAERPERPERAERPEPPVVDVVLASDEADEGDEGDEEEGPEDEGAEGSAVVDASAPGAEGGSAQGADRRRRRRRRRRRGGRGRGGREGAAADAAAGTGASPATASPAGERAGGEPAGGAPAPRETSGEASSGEGSSGGAPPPTRESSGGEGIG